MSTLDWIGKAAVIYHHKEIPFRLLCMNEELTLGDLSSGNSLLQGDNLEALKALLPYYASRVKCIYIDPPYNTGDENWEYNDAVNSPEIKKWLGKTVGKEAEDLSRHDKWLCMMYPRLSLLKQFLREDGVIFVSIDENEVGSLRLLMDEIFVGTNHLGTLVWKRRSSSAMRGTPLSIDHEYILVYGRNANKTTLYGLETGIESYPYEDERGRYASTDLTVGMTKDARPGQFYPITNPRTGKEYQPNPERVWRFYPETMHKVIQEDLIIWPDEQNGSMTRPRYKTYYNPEQTKPKPFSSWIETSSTNDREITGEETEFDIQILKSGMNQEGGRLLQKLFGSKTFAYPKPLSLVRSIIRASTRADDIVMDSFAGTGTTAHAVLDLNNEDGGKRRFILVELDKEIARAITFERLRRAIEGYTWTTSKGKEYHEDGLGGGFRYYELGDTLFDHNGQIREEVTFAELAQHIYFTETNQTLPGTASRDSALLGTADGTAIYLLYDGVPKDRTSLGGSVLTQSLLSSLPAHDGPKVIYGTGCLISFERLKRMAITFRQIPYDVKLN
jgi:adenine-specific DNA-methyltransferase